MEAEGQRDFGRLVEVRFEYGFVEDEEGGEDGEGEFVGGGAAEFGEEVGGGEGGGDGEALEGDRWSIVSVPCA